MLTVLKNGRSGLVHAVTLALCLASAGPAWADAKVYQQVAPSTVVIFGPGGALGSGVLIDEDQRLVATAAHVAGDADSVTVLFAEKGKDGRVITEGRYYREHKEKLSILAKVMARDARRDLAVLQLEHLPEGVKAVKLAQASPTPGENVHVIGNSPWQHGGAFRYCQGTVSCVFLWDPPALPIVARVVAHHAPTNKGDSGGPVVNDQGELVAIISQGTIGTSNNRESWDYQQQVVDHSICVTELQDMLRGERLTAAR